MMKTGLNLNISTKVNVNFKEQISLRNQPISK